jgi:hypothetical protein
MNRFDWIDVGPTRAQFSGSIRGWDELGHETFAVEIAGTAWYGEIDKVYTENKHDFNLEVASFGYGSINNVGNLEGRALFDRRAIDLVMASTARLVEKIYTLENKARPSPLHELDGSHFLGNIFFREGWILEG